MKKFAMKVKAIARVDEGNIKKDHREYGLLTEAEKQAFVKYLESLDFTAAHNQELERALKEDTEEIISAVIAGETDDESLLYEAKSYYYYFTQDMAEAEAASA